MSKRWSAQRTLDQAVTAIKTGDAERAIALAEDNALTWYLESNRSVLAQLLASMAATGHEMLLTYVREKLLADRTLVHARFAGRTLLHTTAAAGEVAMVELLLDLGADPNTTDDGGHAPLYSLANECNTRGGGLAVRSLVQAGAHVDACGGVKRCTALHMAARRGNVEIAEALLDCGADIQARDSLGVTPHRRAVNCRQRAVAELLLARGAPSLSR